VYEAAATIPLSAPEDTSPIFAISAEGVRGGLMSRRESVVVCDFKSVVAEWTTAMGFGRVLVESCDPDEAVVEGAREDWKCVRRACVVCVSAMRELKSLVLAIFRALVVGVG
jgi:hypothetical protein